MKLYTFYLTLPDKASMYRYYNENMINDFLEVSYVESLEKIYQEEKDMWTYMYAWTTKTSYAKEFIMMHDMDMFTMVKRNIDNSDYDLVKRMYPDTELMEYCYLETLNSRSGMNSKNVNESSRDEYLIIPKFESVDFEFIAEMWLNDKLMDDITYFPYDILKNKFNPMLEYLGITTFYDEIVNPEEAFDRESYGVTPYGIANGIFWKPDLFSIYCHLFRLILVKEKEILK